MRPKPDFGRSGQGSVLSGQAGRASPASQTRLRQRGRLMPDQYTAEKRSDIMRRVKGKNTALELKVRSALHRRGLRFRLNYPLPGRPDLVFVRARLAIFIDSCYWHGCPQHLRLPETNHEYWRAKITRNIERDAEVTASYEGSGWRLLRIWEHEVRHDFEECLRRVEDLVHHSGPEPEADSL